MSTTWTVETCPKCQARNWLCHGDLSDDTAPDIEAVECWSCRGRWWLFDAVELESIHGGELIPEGGEFMTFQEMLEAGIGMIEAGRASPADTWRSVT